jgi:hypothetical protein
LPLPLQAQQESSINVQPWFDITLFNEFSDRIEYYGDGGYRRILGVELPWNRYYIRPAVKYSPASWLGIRMGVALFFTENTGIPNILELRPWQGVSIGWPNFKRLRFSHYFRLEERIIYPTDTWDNSFDLRFRYQLSVRIQPNIRKRVKYVYFPIFGELFANQYEGQAGILDVYRNEGRIGVGLGYVFNSRLSGTFSFIFQRSVNEWGMFNTTDYLLRFSLRYELVRRVQSDQLIE